MNKAKLTTWVITLLIIANSVIAPSLINEEDSKAISGALGNVGYYFSTLINWLQYSGYWIGYWILILLFFFLVYILMLWLPLHLYPKFLQYYNFFSRIFGITPPTL